MAPALALAAPALSPPEPLAWGTPAETQLPQGLLARLQPTKACTKDGSSPTQHRPGEKQGDAKQLLFAAACMGHAQVGDW